MAYPSAMPSPGAARLPAPTPIPVRRLAPWTIFGAVLALVLIYFVGAEEGAASLLGGTWVHEFAHDGRHLLGFPCH